MRFFTSLFFLLLVSGSVFAKDVKTEIKVDGMSCGACSVSVQRTLAKVKGVKSADVGYDKGVAIIIYDDAQTNEQLREAINRTGFKAESKPEKK